MKSDLRAKKIAGSAAASGEAMDFFSAWRDDHFPAEHDGVVGHFVSLFD